MENSESHSESRKTTVRDTEEGDPESHSDVHEGMEGWNGIPTKDRVTTIHLAIPEDTERWKEGTGDHSRE